MMVKNFFILQLGVKMKKSKRYIKKQNNKPLINKKVLAKVIRKSNICKHAIKELKLAGYGKGEGGPDDWMYQQVIEAVAVFASHGNSGGSAPWEINLVQKLCDWDIISPLRFTDEEWMQISSDGTCQNRRKGNVFKEPDGSIQWKECSCLKGIRLEDVTAELEEEAYEEMRNNK